MRTSVLVQAARSDTIPVPPGLTAEVMRHAADARTAWATVDADGRSFRRIEIQSAAREGRFDFYAVEPGLYVWLTQLKLHAHKLGHASARLRFTGEDLVEFHYRLAGAATLFVGCESRRVAEAMPLLCYQPENCAPVTESIAINRHARDVSVSLFCSREWLYNAFGCELDALPAPIDEIVRGGQREPLCRLLPQPPGAARTLASLVTNSHSHGAGMLRARADALQLCTSSFEMLTMPCGDLACCKLRLTDRDLASLACARQIIETAHARPPSLRELSRHTGINMAKLTYGFKWRYGETIGKFVRRTRLERARHLLRTTDLQIGQIASAVGYRHQSTFSAAFTAHFAVKPRTMTKAHLRLGLTQHMMSGNRGSVVEGDE